jgi:hypothetical protein
VQRDPGRIDHALRTRLPPHVELHVQTSLDVSGELLGIGVDRRRAVCVDNLLSDLGEDFAQTVAHCVTTGCHNQISQPVAAQQLVNRRQMT